MSPFCRGEPERDRECERSREAERSREPERERDRDRERDLDLLARPSSTRFGEVSLLRERDLSLEFAFGDRDLDREGDLSPFLSAEPLGELERRSDLRDAERRSDLRVAERDFERLRSLERDLD